MELCAYHGTPRKNVQSIQNRGLNISTGRNKWLGDGIYFFETNSITNGFEEAKNWVVKVKHEPDWAVFQADIQSDDFIDLVGSSEHKKLFCELREKVYELHKKSKNADKNFEESGIYLALRKSMTADFIRALVNSDKYQKYGYSSYTVLAPQIQICVIEKSCIKNVKLYKEGKDESRNRRFEKFIKSF